MYRLFAEDGALLYIGSAYNPDERCKAHEKTEWWPQVARRTDEWFNHRGTAYVEELKAIAVEQSKYNVMGTPEYRTPQTEAIQRRNALAPLRSRLVMQASGLADDISSAAREAGYPEREAGRAGTLAEIEFLEGTGLFTASVKERRRRLASQP